MEGGAVATAVGGQDQAQAQQQQLPPKVVERLNPAVQQQLNLESVKIRAISLFKAISRILEDFDNIARTNTTPKWQDIMGQFSMVNLELYNIVEDIKKVSKAFVVHPKNVNAENATILPVMLSSKLLPEMEAEDNSKREQLLHGMQNLPIPAQIEKLKVRIDMIGAACESAEKVIADCRKAYGLGARQGPAIIPTLDKVQAAKIQEQESILRAVVNSGHGLQIPGDQRQLPSSLPMHLADVLTGDGVQGFSDASGIYPKIAQPSLSSNNANTQGSVLQPTGAHLIGRSIPSPSGPTGITSFDNTSTSPLPYANSPRSSTNIMNTPSPQQQTQQQQQQQQQQHQQQQQQQRQKIMQLPNQQQLLAQQQYNRQSSTPGLGQNQSQQLHDMQSQSQKFQSHQMQYSQSLAQQQFQNRQQQPGHLQHNIGLNQLTQGNHLRSHLGQFSGTANNSALFNAAQSSPNAQMITNMSATMTSQSLLPRMQFGLSSGHPQRSHTSQISSDQMFSMGATNPGSMMPVQQQQQALGGQGGFGSMAANTQNLQSSGVQGGFGSMAANAQNLQSSGVQGGFGSMAANAQNLQSSGVQGGFGNMSANAQNLQSSGVQGGFGNMSANAQNLQSNVVQMQNASQIPNFQQQRQQNQQ